MPVGKMHADELETDAPLVRRLLAAQFPQWADLPIQRVPSAGTDNALYRIGDELVARLPRIHWAVEGIEKEERWLPRLAPHLPLPIPTPLAHGRPGEGYPWHWSVYRWLDGADATLAPPDDLGQAARDLAHFLKTLWQIDPAGGPHSQRGMPLAARDAETRAAIAELKTMPELGLDLDATAAAWDAALAAQAWSAPHVWIHGDLAPLNVVVQDGQLSAVIDWGCVGLGDPACDVMVAWKMFPAEAREVFRAELGVEDATWARGAGWALSTGLIAIPYYRHTNPGLASVGRRGIEEVLADRANRASVPD